MRRDALAHRAVAHFDLASEFARRFRIDFGRRSATRLGSTERARRRLRHTRQVHAEQRAHARQHSTRGAFERALAKLEARQALAAALEVDALADRGVGVDALPEARTVQPIVVQREQHRNAPRRRLLDAPDRQVQQVLKVHDVRAFSVEQRAEGRVDRRVVPGLAKGRVVEVVDQLRDAHAFPNAFTHREVAQRDVLVGREDAQLVPALDQLARELCRVQLGTRTVRGRKIVCDEQDTHGAARSLASVPRVNYVGAAHEQRDTVPNHSE